MENPRLQEHFAIAKAPRFSVHLARTAADVRDAQRLRYKVFVEEFGARPSGWRDGLDCDHFDAHCDHLIVRESEVGRVVGTYRILTPEALRRLGASYADSEFYMTRLGHLRDQTIELGRSCIHRDYRSGAVIALLWSALADYMVAGGYQYLMGCASIPMTDGGRNAANLYAALRPEQQAPAEYRVFPVHRLPWEELVDGAPPLMPALLKGYLRAGAWVCGEPAWDAEFNAADLPLLLPLQRLDGRYARRFLRVET